MENKPFYELQEQDKKNILELLETCKRIELGNISFESFKINNKTENIKFYLNGINTFWELVVKVDKKDNMGLYWFYTDIYKIENDIIEYKYSEKDLQE